PERLLCPALKGDVPPVPGPVARELQLVALGQELLLAASTGRLRVEVELTAAVRAEDDRLPIGRPDGLDVRGGIEGEAGARSAREVADPDVGSSRPGIVQDVREPVARG